MAGEVTTDEMAPGEVARRLEDLTRETRDLASRMLLREVYDARQEVIVARIGQVERSQMDAVAERAATRRLVIGGVITFFASTAVQVITVVITLLASKG